MGDRDVRAMPAVCTAILILLILAALYLARSIVAPVTFAIFVIALVWPLQAALQARMPKLLAMAMTVVFTITVVVALGYMVLWGFSQAGQWLIANAARFQALYDETAKWLEGYGLYTAGMLAESYNVRWLVLAVQRIAASLQA